MTLRPRLRELGMMILNAGGGGMVSNHRLVLFTRALCRLSYPAACGPLGEGSGGRGACRSPKGSAPRTLSAGQRSITSGFNRKGPGCNQGRAPQTNWPDEGEAPTAE